VLERRAGGDDGGMELVMRSRELCRRITKAHAKQAPSLYEHSLADSSSVRLAADLLQSSNNHCDYTAQRILGVSIVRHGLLQTVAADHCCIIPAHGPANQPHTQVSS
jgi:hypothetical protein